MSTVVVVVVTTRKSAGVVRGANIKVRVVGKTAVVWGLELDRALAEREAQQEALGYRIMRDRPRE